MMMRFEERSRRLFQRGQLRKQRCSSHGPIIRRNDPVEFAKAVADFDKAIELDPDLGLAYAHRADVKSDMGQYEEALRDMERAVRLCPRDAWVRGLRGRIRILAGKLDGVERDLKTALSLNPDLDWAYGCLAELRWRKGDAHAALEFLNKSLDCRVDENPTMYLARAGVLIKMKKWRAALDDLNEGADISDCPPAVFRLREHVRCELENYGGAIDDLDALAANDPSYAAHWDYKPAMYQFAVSAHTPQSLLDLIRRHPLYSQGHVWLGELFVKIGQPARALPHLERALNLPPYSSWAYFWKAQALKNSGRLPEAVQCLDAALTRVSKHSRALFLRGEIRLQLGHRKRALRDMGEAVRWNSLDAGMRRCWAEAKAAAG